MATPRHLNNAPIREGLISLQFDAVSLDAVKAFSEAIASGYSNALDIWSHAFELHIGGDLAPTKNERSANGRRFDSPREGPPHVVLAQRNSFTFSRLQPYDDWDDLRGSALPLWNLFVEIARPERVTRVAVRYINAMVLPLRPGEDFSKYLTASPQLPPELPQDVTGFLQRVVTQDSKGNLAVVTQAFEGAEASGSAEITVIMDIDVFRNAHLRPEDAEVWSILDNLRHFKNNIFFAHLTEDAMELFQ
ncbi:TIGR04255 family protein [Variovorax paradoxus]|uniref:TIGR04255 family protein n=1 Tax=Variovorax paradoxus TaxID=34073 RepID=UPI003D6499CA